MANPNSTLARIVEIEGRLSAALIAGESTIRIRSELAQARRDHAEADEAERNARDEAEAIRAKRIAEHAATIADQVNDSINSRLADLAPPAGI